MRVFIAAVLATALSAGVSAAEEQEAAKGTIFTLWPLVDYRTSPKEDFRNLSILGPLFKFQKKGDDLDTAFRPFMYRTDNLKNRTTSTYFLYPAAYRENTPQADTYEVLRLFQTNHFHKGEDQAGEGTAMLFPFYIAGKSKDGQDYQSFFPFYGDIYGRFWKDEYHYAMFPLYGRTVDKGTTTRHYLYPIFSTTSGEKESGFEVFPLYGQSHKEGVYNKRFVLWPFYTSWQTGLNTDNPTDKTVIFPLYGRTVDKGTTTKHYLYPIFSTTSGEKESGFEVFPLYGQSHKEGVYNKRFVLWPFYTSWQTGLDTDNPTDKTIVFPFYGRIDSPKRTTRSYLWPFFGYTINHEKKFTEVDYFWPFISTIRGEKRNANSFLPLYSRDTFADGERRWYLWPLFRHEEIRSETFNRDSNRVLFFLYRGNHESWPKDGTERSRIAAWPLFLYESKTRGTYSFSFPAPVESILDKEGIEKNWAPLWRLYQRRWDEDGNSASTFLWNLYWHERRGEELAYEVFPLVSYRGVKGESELKFLKGLVSLKRGDRESELSLLWMPFGLKWGGK